MRHPDKALTAADVPSPVKGAARYDVQQYKTGGYDIIMYPPGEPASMIDHKPNEQSAIRACIRWQKRENAAVIKAAKKGKL